MLTKEQKKSRQSYVGASDVPKIIFGQAYTIFFQKMGLDHRTSMSEFAYAGSVLEEAVAKLFFEPYTGYKVRRLNAELRHEKYPWLGGHIDFRIANEKAGYEGKCRTAYVRQKWGRVEHNPREFSLDGKILNYTIPDMDEAKGFYVPRDEYYQVQTYLLWNKMFDWYVISTLLDGNTLLTRKILPNKEVQEEIIDKTRNFWECVKKRRTPKPTGFDSEMVNMNYQADVGTSIDLSDDLQLQDWFRQYDDMRADSKAVEEKKAEIKNWIITEKLKNNSSLVCLNRKISWNRKNNRFYMGTTGKGYING